MPTASWRGPEPVARRLPSFGWSVVLAAMWLAAQPAVAGEVVIPVLRGAGLQNDLGVTVEPSARITNLGGVARRVAARFVAAGMDGTKSGVALLSRTLPPSGLAQADDAVAAPGLIVVSGAPQMTVNGQMAVGWGSHVQVSGFTVLPALRASDGARPGQSVIVPGILWLRFVAGGGVGSGGAVGDLGVVNLARTGARCTIEVADEPGLFPDPIVLEVPPLSLAALPDLIGARVGADARNLIVVSPRVRCDRQFYAFAIDFFAEADLSHRAQVLTPSVGLAP